MTFARISSIQSDLAGAAVIEREARRLWLRGQGEWFAEAASRLREASDGVSWADRIGKSRPVDQRKELWHR